MKQQVETALDIVRDPLLRATKFPHAQVYFPYGVPLRVRSNSPAILDAAEQSFGRFQQILDLPPMEMHIGVAGDLEGSLPPPPVFRSRQHLLTLTGDAEHFGVCDFASSFAYCWLTPRMLNHPSVLRYFYLEAMAYSMVSEHHLTPVHGACVSWQGRGVLLCGPSCAGKSTLAYACARQGFTYTSDDGSFLLRALPGRTVTGNPYSIRFRPSATTLFPELDQSLAALRANGKITIDVATAILHLAATSPSANVESLVYLNRHPSSPTRLEPFSKELARQSMEESIHYGRDSAMREQRESLERLLELPVFELTYSGLPSAVERLRILLETGQ